MTRLNAGQMYLHPAELKIKTFWFAIKGHPTETLESNRSRFLKWGLRFGFGFRVIIQRHCRCFKTNGAGLDSFSPVRDFAKVD